MLINSFVAKIIRLGKNLRLLASTVFEFLCVNNSSSYRRPNFVSIILKPQLEPIFLKNCFQIQKRLNEKIPTVKINSNIFVSCHIFIIVSYIHLSYIIVMLMYVYISNSMMLSKLSLDLF